MTNLDTGGELSADDRAAMRAFLQRSEVRLSTFHRVALSLLSGAGLLVVLPVVARDAIAGVIRSLVIGNITVLDTLLIVAVAAVLVVPAAALWMLVAELTRFYFHANHVGRRGAEVFTPRFTLTSLHLPNDELGPAAARALDHQRGSDRIVELLVPSNEASRRRIDRQLHVYHDLGHEPARTDRQRADGLFELAAATGRSLAEEVAKVEFGMARHALRLRDLVLRYVKALLALLVSAGAVYACDATVEGIPATDDVGASGIVWIAAIVLVWAPVSLLAITSPVRWIETQMRREGAPSTAIADDPELTSLERVSIPIVGVGWVAAAAAMVIGAFDDDVTTAGTAAGIGALIISVLAVVSAAMSGRFNSLVGLGVRD